MRELETTAVETRPAPVKAPGLAASSRLGRYYVLHQIGEGGMGAVYVGFDELLDRRVALKVLHRGSAAREWLMREGQALGRLSHPNVVAIYEVGEQDGRGFLAMEMVEGSTLSAWLDETSRSFADVLRLFVQAGRGLAAVHRAGLVHGDFKAENVLVGKDGRPRVADFSLAALADALAAPVGGEAPSTNLLASPPTPRGSLVGTPAYMAPEQFEGAPATRATDQWSFAVALYRAAYGTPPVVATDLDALMCAVLHEAPTVPARRPGVPPWLWPILQRCLERDPERRFLSMEELLAAIEEHVPRDPEFDPTVVVRGRQALSLGYVAFNVVYGALFLHPSTVGAMTGPAGLLALPALCLALMLATIALQWRQLARNRYGRRLAAIFSIGCFALVGHRALALHMGLTPSHVLAEDAFVLAVVYGMVAAVAGLPWTSWLSAIWALTTVACALTPSHVARYAGIGCLLSAVAMSVRLYVDRHVNPRDAVGPLDVGAEPRG